MENMLCMFLSSVKSEIRKQNFAVLAISLVSEEHIDRQICLYDLQSFRKLEENKFLGDMCDMYNVNIHLNIVEIQGRCV